MPNSASHSAPPTMDVTIPSAEAFPERTIKVAEATLERGRYSWLWVVRSCPFCAKAHDHFGGPLEGDPYLYAGTPVAARCDRTDRRLLSVGYGTGDLWYILTPIAPEP